MEEILRDHEQYQNDYSTTQVAVVSELHLLEDVSTYVSKEKTNEQPRIVLP